MRGIEANEKGSVSEMYVQISAEEIRMLQDLVMSQIKQLEDGVDREVLAEGGHPHSELWKRLECLLHRLREADCDVLA